ncbi:hypothetical protein [Streptomyces sp. NPDC060002]|uniref:hypothetical protein n=1 Tax=Streptomyces sp. NPDC060002 TaxID=3347033 RepID=UPI003682166D
MAPSTPSHWGLSGEPSPIHDHGRAAHRQRAERRPAAEHWLLLSADDIATARAEWRNCGVALLHIGVRVGAVGISGTLVHAAAGTDDPARVSAYLGRALLGGPVFFHRSIERYYVLVQGSTGRRPELERAGDDAEFTGSAHYLGVPALDVTTPEAGHTFWSVEFESAGVLASADVLRQLVDCCRLRVAQTISAGRRIGD